jgi:hypothetical protein
MGNWILDGTAVAWDENAPEYVDQEGIEGIDLGETYPASDEGDFDPGKHSIADVKAYVEAHPDETQAIYDAESEGKGRSSLLDWLSTD